MPSHGLCNTALSAAHHGKYRYWLADGVPFKLWHRDQICVKMTVLRPQTGKKRKARRKFMREVMSKEQSYYYIKSI